MIVCIDAHICIWGIKKQSVRGQEENIEKAERFLKHLDEQKAHVIIPSIVLAEILTPEPEAARIGYMDIIPKNFIIANFDEMAAMKFAEILHTKLSDAKAYMAEKSIRKDKMKFDYAIVACAIVNNADCIYSNDTDIKKFAEGLIEVREMPIIAKQAEMTFNEEEEK